MARIGYRQWVVGLVLMVGLTTPALAEVKLSSLFSDNCVLQQGVPAPVWGTATPGEQVTVTIEQSKATATADKDGKWMAKVGPLKAGGPFEMTVAGSNTLTVKNVLVGEVWVCSGQSNMAFGLGSSINGPAEVAEANYPEIRYYQVPNKTFTGPIDDANSGWVVCEPGAASRFSAVGYFFGRQLHQQLKVPVGLIGCAWGGMPAQAYTPRAAMEQSDDFRGIVEGFKQSVANYPQTLANYKANEANIQADYQAKVAKWEPTTQDVSPQDPNYKKLMGTKPRQPQAPGDPALSPGSPGVLWDSMIHPLLPYGIAGAIWYQGESDAGHAYQYRSLFPFMIQQWRKGFAQDVPFFFVQLANYMAVTNEANEGSAWAELREAQSMTLSLLKTGMAVIIDIGEAKDIHPKNKQDVGKRLALNALKTVYKQDIIAQSPMYESMKVEGNKVLIKFKNVGTGLVAKPVDANITQGNGQLRWFAIAGEDNHFVWANAMIQGNDTVVVSSEKVANPTAVRYAWANNPEGCNLYNKEGLPASPFRTDALPGVTAGTAVKSASQPASGTK